jgi:CO/xanthine dehydrogenase Mo-binding subunit
MNALPGLLNDNPRLDLWVSFPAPGQVTIKTGRVELGQGVLTAMAQLAADELDVAMSRIAIRSGDTTLTPNEGYTAGSQSMQTGGVAMRQACADVRVLFIAAAANALACAPGELSIRDGQFLRNGTPTGQDYWTLAGTVDLTVKATGAGACKSSADLDVTGRSSARIDLPAKIFGQATFIHDMTIAGMKHARVVRQPNPGATVGAIDEAAIKRAANGAVTLVRSGDFLAIVGDNETAIERAGAAAVNAVTWQHVETPAPLQQEANWLLQRPVVDRLIGTPEPSDAQGRERFEATYSRGYLAHASISPSCGLAEFRDGTLTVWTHCQGVFPLRAALARMLKLDAANIVVHHVQASGCYGHNGADDAAADAAAIAMQMPGVPVRVRWRREEEFIYEPKSPAMLVKVRALVDADGKPSDWTAEIWSGNHNGRPGGGNPLLPGYALPDQEPMPPAGEVPEAAGGGATRNAEPLYTIPDKRIIHHMVSEPPVRVSSLRGLGAMPNVFALECAIDELAERAGVDPVVYRLSITTDRRARAVIEKVAAMATGRPVPPAATGAAVASAFHATRTAPPIPPSLLISTSTRKSGCAISGAQPTPASSSIRTAPSTSSKAALFSRQAGYSRNRFASTPAPSQAWPRSIGRPIRS